MASEEFKTGDLVWARMKGFPPWPAKIVDPPPSQKAPKYKKAHFVYFFGSKDYAWILDDKMFHLNERAFDNLAKKKSAVYQKAVDELMDESRSLTKDKQGFPKIKKEKTQPEEEENETNLREKQSSQKAKKVKNQDEETSGFSSKPVKKKKSPKANEILGPSTKVVKITQGVPKKKERKVLTRKLTPKNSFNKKFGQNYDASQNKYSPSKSTSSDDSPKRDIRRSLFSSDLPVRALSRKRDPSGQKFGFIGLGDMGDAIVSNLLVSGHDVTVWNKTPLKCEKYVAMGAKQVRSPAELITDCDITFCCVSDKEASKALIFGDRGILKGLEMSQEKGLEPKGYVEMTSIDPETSITINEAINMKHGVYLEAPFRGSIRQAQKGELLFLASGDRDLFAKCETCFHCFSKYAYYLTCDVGQASKVSLLLSYMSDSMCVLVAEALVLGDRLGVKKEDFLKIIRNRKDDPGIFGYKRLIEIYHLMSRRGNEVLVTQKHVHKDIQLALDMADQFSQSMPFTSTVNQVFIRAKRQALNEKHSD